MCGCGASDHYAPVADLSTLINQRKPASQAPKVLAHQSKAVRTLSQRVTVRSVAELQPIPEMKSIWPIDTSNNSRLKWQWPTQGKIVKTYSAVTKGVDIINRLGEPIYAARAGKVVYCGSGIKGYGNLIIIKHRNAYMTMYAHNSKVYVKSGQSVIKGQKIAEMGKSGSNQVKLYFQVRYRGQPIDPKNLF
jgi:lipoprotein NlpD